MRLTNRPKEVMRVAAHEGRIVVMDEAGRIAWEDANESRMVHRLFAFAVAPDALDALDETTDFLERGSQSQPQYLAQRGRRIAANRLILARSLPGREELQALANRSRQLNLWRRAA